MGEGGRTRGGGVRALADRARLALSRRGWGDQSTGGGRPRTRGGRSERQGRLRRTRVEVSYQPERDGHPDAGEVVWSWIPFKEDPREGKDRPVVVIGMAGDRFVVVPLTSKQHPERDDHIAIGSGAWDPERRVSYAKLDRILALRENQIRREGSSLERRRFDALVEALARLDGWPTIPLEYVE